MNKIFLFAKHAKTSENCDKLSRSVSYETLVGGTTTAGKDYKQTQCLSKGYAGYRFCKTMRFSYENLMDRLLQTLPVFKKVCESRRKSLISGFNLIRRSLEFFAFAQVAPAKNRDDSLLFLASPRTRFSEIATSAFRLLAMTPITLALAAILSIGTISESRASTNVYTYDVNGNLTSERYCETVAADGSCSVYSNSGYDYNYDANNNLTSKRVCETVATDGSCSVYENNSWTTRFYTYDANNNLISESRCKSVASDGSCTVYDNSYRREYTYDANNNMTSQRDCKSVASDGSCTVYDSDRMEYTYDVKGNQTSVARCVNVSFDGKCLAYSYRSDHTYDADNNRTFSRTCYTIASDGSCAVYDGSSNEYIYDKNGNKISYRQCNTVAADGSCSEYASGGGNNYTYDANGNMTSERACKTVDAVDGTCSDYFWSDYYNYEYDEWGNVINKYKNGSLIESSSYADEYYAKMEKMYEECNAAATCAKCKSVEFLQSGKCIPGYEWVDGNTVVLSDEMPTIVQDIFGLNNTTGDLNVICRGDMEKCEEILGGYANLMAENYTGVGVSGNPYFVGQSGNPSELPTLNIVPADETNCETDRYYWSGTSCNNKKNGVVCGENFKQVESWCNRVRYTPADAAKVLKDTDNEIIMTFKVNR